MFRASSKVNFLYLVRLAFISQGILRRTGTKKDTFMIIFRRETSMKKTFWAPLFFIL